MNLRVTHYGYAYQDLITGIALVDLMLGTATDITVDTKGFPGDRFDDLNIGYRTGRRVRIQVKHTTQDRELAKSTFSGDGRSLKLNKLLDALLHDLAGNPETTYRVIVCDGGPDEDLAKVLKPIAPSSDPGDPLPGVSTRRFNFDPQSLRASNPWKTLVQHLTDEHLHRACQRLTIDTGAPPSTLDFAEPGPAERILLRRVTEELGAGRPPNSHVIPDYAALALAHAATGARARDGNVTRETVAPRVGLITDFGAVAEGHPVEAAVAVPRAGAVVMLRDAIDAVASTGGRVVVTGEPGVGKSWLCEQLADHYQGAGWIVARHHCWLGAADVNRDERVLTDVVIGSLLRQLEQTVPEATIDLRPRFAATVEALATTLQACSDTQSERNVLLIVDGIDHVDRVLGRRTNQNIDPSRMLVDQLAAIKLPRGVCMLIASQPGPHLQNADARAGEPMRMPRMSWDEVRILTQNHGLLAPNNEDHQTDVDDKRRIVDLVYNRSGGNALYATYLCRYATRVSPLDADDTAPVTNTDIIRRLNLVPETATDIDAYYAHLVGAMTPDQEYAIGTLALCDFALSADELGEVLPAAKPLLSQALMTLAPLLNSQPGLGGLRIHHESFSRHILRDKDEQWVAAIRESTAAWLATRGFFTDARAFRHLPELLAQLDRYDELKELIQPGFVAGGIFALQPPEALQRVVGIVARESEARLDWPTLIACVESRKAIDTYEAESLPESIVDYADVVVAILGADVVAERLVYEARPTFPPRWGLRICRAVDQAGVAAPWKVYIEARKREAERERSTYSSDRDGTLHLALQLGALRLRNPRSEINAEVAGRIARELGKDRDASLADRTEVFTAGLPAAFMLDVAAAMADPDKAARVYLTLADLSASGTPGLPDRTALAREAWVLSPELDITGYLLHGIPANEVLARLEITDLEAALRALTDTVIAAPTADHDVVQQWLALLTLAHATDRSTPLRLASRITGIGFYRAWMRYTVATVGIADDVAAGVTTVDDASSAVRVALADLAAEATPFAGDPRACDLYFVHPLIHETIEATLVVVQPDDLDAVLDHLIAIGDGTTTSTMGLAENGPLATNDLLEILSRVADYIGVNAIHSLLEVIRERRNDTNTQYSVTAGFELATARICFGAGAKDEATQCWRRASLLLASYGGHKDPTISEILDSVDDIADVDIDVARASLAKLADMVYLVRQHTDGRDTAHFVNSWWEKATAIDPIAAATDGADTLLAELGFEDGRVHTAHTHLLQNQIKSADPVGLAALRLTVGTDWRHPGIDLDLANRLESLIGVSPQVDSALAIVANNIAASYDDQPMMYANESSKSVATPDLVDAIVRLGGAAFGIRAPRPDERPSSRWDVDPKLESTAIQQRLISDQRPILPGGRKGAVLAARDFELKQYRDDADAPRWNIDALANAIGWRIIEATLQDGAEAGTELVDDVAREMFRYSSNTEVLAIVAEGLAIRCDGTSEALATVASYCLTVAFIRIRAGGGLRTFAGRAKTNLWTTAQNLDPVTAERTLAAAVTRTVEADAQRTYGVTQGVIAAFAAKPTETPEGNAVSCWEAATEVIRHRLPGTAQNVGHTYRPTESPDKQEDLDVAIATLALATVSQPMRTDILQALLATAVLLTCRPTVGQKALVHVLQSELDAGRTTWLLDVIADCLPAGSLSDDLTFELTRLAATDWLSVRVLAARVLEEHGRPVPNPPATDPAGPVRAAFRGIYAERD